MAEAFDEYGELVARPSPFGRRPPRAHERGGAVASARERSLRRYFLLAMANAARGVLRGVTITLDAPVPPLDGQRVRLVIEPETESHVSGDLSPAERAALLREWATQGPQGPIDDVRTFRTAVIERGDIRWFRFHRPDKRRPVLVLGMSQSPLNS